MMSIKDSECIIFVWEVLYSILGNGMIDVSDSTLQLLKKIKPTQYVLLVLIFLSSFTPGYLAIFVFKRDLFIQLDMMKLVLLAIALSLPSCILIYFLKKLFRILHEPLTALVYSEVSLTSVCLLSSFVQYLSLLVARKWGGDLYGYVQISSLNHLAVILFVVVESWLFPMISDFVPKMKPHTAVVLYVLYWVFACLLIALMYKFIE